MIEEIITIQQEIKIKYETEEDREKVIKVISEDTNYIAGSETRNGNYVYSKHGKPIIVE